MKRGLSYARLPPARSQFMFDRPPPTPPAQPPGCKWCHGQSAVLHPALQPWSTQSRRPCGGPSGRPHRGLRRRRSHGGPGPDPGEGVCCGSSARTSRRPGSRCRAVARRSAGAPHASAGSPGTTSSSFPTGQQACGRSARAMSAATTRQASRRRPGHGHAGPGIGPERAVASPSTRPVARFTLPLLQAWRSTGAGGSRLARVCRRA
jgi:hypothetical protein